MELDSQHIHAGQSSASRVIKYAVTLGYRLESYNLVQLRIHDMRLEVDLARHDPLNPTFPPPTADPEEGMDFDGTSDGYIDSLDESEIDEHLSKADEETDTYWTGPWPEINFERTPSDAGDTAFHMKVDLLRTVTVCSVDEGSYYEPQDAFLEEVIIEFLLIECVTLALFYGMSRCCDYFEYSGMNNLPALALSFVLWVSAVVYAMVAVYSLAAERDIWDWAGAMYCILGYQCLFAGFGDVVGPFFLAVTVGNLFNGVKYMLMSQAIEAATGLWLKRLYFSLAAALFFSLAWKCWNGGF